MSFGRKAVLIGGALAIFGAGILIGANKFAKPASVIHVVTVKWNDGVTDAQKQQVIAGIEKMASEVPGIRNVWLKTLKVQGEGYGNVFVMEFKDEASFKAYSSHPAHKAWEEIYLPLRDHSTTHDASN